jgi:hypothetical protein
MSLVLIDLIGVLLIGSVVAIATSAVQSKPLPQVISSFINLINLESSTPQNIAKLFGIVAAISPA